MLKSIFFILVIYLKLTKYAKVNVNLKDANVTF